MNAVAKNVKESLHANNKKGGVTVVASSRVDSFLLLPVHICYRCAHACDFYCPHLSLLFFHSEPLGRLQDADVVVVVHLEPFLPCRDHMWPASRGATFCSGSILTRERRHLTSPCRLTNPKSCTTQSYCHQKHSGINLSSVDSCALFSKAWLFRQTGHEYYLFEKN